MLAEIRLIHVDEYHQMAEAGILDPDERVELIDGQIYKMAAKGTAHSAAITQTERTFRQLLGTRALIRLQDPIRLNDYSEPEPDVAIVQLDPLDYADHHPTVSEVFLVIEVADTTLRRDCQFKANVYAKAGIADYWVVDVTARQLSVFRSPQPEGYRNQLVLLDDGTIAPLHFPEVTIAVANLLPKISG